MEYRKPIDIDSFHTKIIYLGLFLNFFVPALFLIIGIFLRSKGLGVNPIESLKLLLVILLIVSGGEIAAIFIFKKKLFSGQGMINPNLRTQSPEQIVFKFAMIIFALGLSPTIYGFVYYLLGGTIEWFVIFVAITLFCFQLFKPKVEEIESIFSGHESEVD